MTDQTDNHRAALDAELRALADALDKLVYAAEMAAGACDRLAAVLERTGR